MVTKPTEEVLRIAAILRAARLEAGFTTAASAARHHGWKIAGYTHHENGIRAIEVDRAKEYARAYGLKISDLLLVDEVIDLPEEITEEFLVAGMSLWRDTELDPLPAIDQRRGPAGGRRKIKMGDDSINKAVEQGEFALYSPVESEDVEIGSLIVIDRHRGKMAQRSVWRVAAVHGNGSWTLTSYSTSPKYKDTKLTVPDTSSDERVELVGLVDGMQRDFGPF